MITIESGSFWCKRTDFDSKWQNTYRKLVELRQFSFLFRFCFVLVITFDFEFWVERNRCRDYKGADQLDICSVGDLWTKHICTQSISMSQLFFHMMRKLRLLKYLEIGERTIPILPIEEFETISVLESIFKKTLKETKHFKIVLKCSVQAKITQN